MKIYLLVAILLVGQVAISKDIIHLKNGERIKTHIIQIDSGMLITQKGKTHELRHYSTEDVEIIYLDENNQAMKSLVANNIQQSIDIKCEEGKADATVYHKRGFGNFCLGFLFGPFGVIGTAIGTPRSPDYTKIPNKENLENANYLNCYKKKAKGKNVGAAFAGWGAIIVLALLAQ